MMIAFITTNSGLVSLIEGLRAQILYFGFETFSNIFCFSGSFSKQKICERKNQLVQDLIPPPSIYIHMCTLYTYTNTHMPRFSPLRALRVSHPDPWAHIRVLHKCCVCACVHIHTPKLTYTPTLIKNIEDTGKPPISAILITPPVTSSK